jgi:plastocyanin
MKLKHFVSVAITGLTVLIILAVNSCSKSSNTPSQPPGGANTQTIDIYNMAFPATVTVAKGTKVSWYNQDGYAHTVTSDDNKTFNSGNLAAAGTFVYLADSAGTFPYHCNIHSNMHGSLVVTP